MDKKIGKNYLFNLIYQVTAIILPMITLPYVSRVLGPTGIGINGFTSANMQYFVFIGTLGISIYGGRTIASVRDNEEKLKKTFWEIILLQITTSLLSFAAFILIFGFNNEFRIYYLIQSIYIISAGLDITWYFVGIEDFKKASIRSTVIKFVSVALIFMFVKSSDDLWQYILINSAFSLVGQGIMWFYLDKSFYKKRYLRGMNIKRHLSPTFALFVPQIATQVYMVLDKTMTGVLSNTTEVAFYDNSQKIMRISLAVVTSLGMVMLPRIAHLNSTGETAKLKLYLKQAFNFMTLASLPILFGLIAISDNFVPWFFGHEYLKVIPLMKLSSVMILVIAWGNVFGTQYLIALGKVRPYTMSVVVGAIINFSMNVLLIPRLLSMGAVIATLSAEVVIFVIQFIYAREIFDITWITSGWKYWVSSIAMFVGVHYVGLLVSSSFLGIGIQISIGMLIYLALLIVFKESFTTSIMKKIINRFSGQVV